MCNMSRAESHFQHNSCTIVVIYRTGAIYDCFFNEFSDLLDRAAVLSEDVVVCGNFNIRIDRAEDLHTRALIGVFSDHGFIQCVDRPTHEKGGILDVVAVCSASPAPVINAFETGLSDHLLLDWTLSLGRPPPVYKTHLQRPWRNFNLNDFLEALKISPLLTCDVRDVDGAATMYGTELRSILDDLIPLRSAIIRLRLSDPWFDEDFREAKRQTRRLERTALRTSKDDDISRWRQQRTAYRKLTHRKRVNFWRDKIERERGSGRELWSSINAIMSRGRVVTNSSPNAEQLSQFFITKLNNVRASTASPLSVWMRFSVSSILSQINSALWIQYQHGF